MPWPCGYDCKLDYLARFGVYTAKHMSPSYNPGYEIVPTVFLTDPSGRVVWHDDRSRAQHRGVPAAEKVAAIEAAIAGGLGGGR